MLLKYKYRLVLKNWLLPGMMVYPNPSNGIFNITSESNAAVLVEVYNLTGGWCCFVRIHAKLCA